MICITRIRLAGLFLALVVGWAGSPSAAWADYQAGVDAYYRHDFQAAYQAWLPLAEAGDAVAQNSIGALFDHGLGVEEDNAEAARWYQMAAQQGLPLAMRNIASQYATGHGVPYDLEMARQWYERAAAAGDQQSAALLSHLRPASPPPSDNTAAAATVFETPSISGNLAEPADSTQPVAAEPAPAATVQPLAPATPSQAAGAGQSVALDVGGQTYSVPLGGTTADAVPAATQPVTAQPAAAQSAATQPAAAQPAAAQPAAAQQVAAQPVAVQQAAIAPSAPRTDGNWLIGQWQGPSLGCPKGGGIEFTDSETMSWFDGQVAVRLASTYRIVGENIFVTTTGADGAPQEYVYQSAGPNKMLIVSVPPAMPKSLIGVAYRRCGEAAPATQQAAVPAATLDAGAAAPAALAPAAVAAAPAAAVPPDASVPTAPAVAAVAPAAPAPAQPAVPDLSAAPVISTPAATAAAAAPSTPAATVAPTPTAPAEPATTAATTDEGWKAFEQGDYTRALGIFRSLGEAGDTNMQVLVGNIFDYGQGVPQDDVQALQWYLMAAGLGNAKGQFLAGSLYYRSNTVPQDLVESYRWLTLAAEGPSQSVGTDPSQSTKIQAQNLLTEVASTMSAADIAKAKALAKKTRQKK